jgi:UDP-glucose 4-epimerase
MERPDDEPGPVVVTGGSGFIGHHLIERLLSQNRPVRNLDVKPSRLRSPNLTDWPGNFQDTARLREALAGVDTVFHLAASRFPRDSNRNPLQDAQENIIGTLGLLDMAVEAGVRRLVFCSSGGTVYGPTSAHLIAEGHPTHPITAYGIGKLAIEKYLRLYSRQHGIGTVALRIANPYGPFQSITKAQGALTTFCHKALRDEEIQIWGDGRVERDYIHVQDVADSAPPKAEFSDCRG